MSLELDGFSTDAFTSANPLSNPTKVKPTWFTWGERFATEANHCTWACVSMEAKPTMIREIPTYTRPIICFLDSPDREGPIEKTTFERLPNGRSAARFMDYSCLDRSLDWNDVEHFL